MMLRFGRWSLALSIAVAILSGCGGSSQRTMAPQVPQVLQLPQAPGRGAASDSSGDLLYVAHVVGEAKHEPHGVVSILTLPHGKVVATIAGLSARGICSDASGNVWVVTYTPKGWYVDKFAHGGTTPIAKIRMPKHAFGNGCAVDPTTGNLAVVNDENGVSYSGAIDVWTGARKGEPALVNVPFVPQDLAYDERGNLYIGGFPGGSDFWLELGELAAGSKAVTRIQLDKRVGFPGDIAWDGKYVAAQTGGDGVRSRIYRVRVSGNMGKVVAAVYPSDPALYYMSWFCLYEGSVIGMAGHSGTQVYVWPYPAGGMHTKFIGRFTSIKGMTISPAAAK